MVGQVKTVNMSGRALVEFLDYHLNTGWFDIELEFLKVVDKPLPKAKEEKKAAPKAEARSLRKRKQPRRPLSLLRRGKPSTADILAKLKGGAGAAPATGDKPSTSDILAKLRGGGAAAPAAKKEEAPKPKSEAKPAAAPAAGGKVDRAKMSVAEMLAAARGGAAAAPAAKSEPAAPKAEAPAPAQSGSTRSHSASRT